MQVLSLPRPHPFHNFKMFWFITNEIFSLAVYQKHTVQWEVEESEAPLSWLKDIKYVRDPESGPKDCSTGGSCDWLHVWKGSLLRWHVKVHDHIFQKGFLTSIKWFLISMGFFEKLAKPITSCERARNIKPEFGIFSRVQFAGTFGKIFSFVRTPHCSKRRNT